MLQVRREDKRLAHSQASYFKGPEEGKREVDQDYTWLEQRRVKDSIYNEFINIPLPYWKYMDNPIYTRLKDLYQLGCLHFVFPGATHSRFSHSLGVGHLA